MHVYSNEVRHRIEKKNYSLCQWFGTRMYVCSTIVPSIKAMWHNILKSLENGFALGKTSHWDNFNWLSSCLFVFKILADFFDGSHKTEVMTEISSSISRHIFEKLPCHIFSRRIGILEQKSIQCVNRHDYLCSSREMEVVGPLPKIDHIFAIIIYGNHEDLISLFYDDALSPSQSYSFGIIWSRSKFVSFLSPEWWMTVSLIPTIKNKLHR